MSCATIPRMISPLTQYRKANGQSLEALARTLGVDKSTLWRWEAGRVPVDRLSDIEAATRISRRELRPDIFGASK